MNCSLFFVVEYNGYLGWSGVVVFVFVVFDVFNYGCVIICECCKRNVMMECSCVFVNMVVDNMLDIFVFD